ncbi:hypothetical protein NDU88_004464 [Pleurodeles waltl]|uniref:Uncharacterized protein n=1 Tax=Pleurodeles waltl TaxID=8319 RepID=A0AAV7SIV0_PLEWA|nr:hypothetical protein NDU88_004464 [Pleurodeles waltl]
MSDGFTTATGGTIPQIANSTTERVRAAASPRHAGAGPGHASPVLQLFCQVGAAMDPAAGHTHNCPPIREPDLQGPGTSRNPPHFLLPQQGSSRIPSVLRSHRWFSCQERHSLRPSQSADSMPGAPPLFTSTDAVRLIPVGRQAARRSYWYRRSVPCSVRHFASWATLQLKDVSATSSHRGENRSWCPMTPLLSFPSVPPIACISLCARRFTQDT